MINKSTIKPWIVIFKSDEKRDNLKLSDANGEVVSNWFLKEPYHTPFKLEHPNGSVEFLQKRKVEDVRRVTDEDARRLKDDTGDRQWYYCPYGHLHSSYPKWEECQCHKRYKMSYLAMRDFILREWTPQEIRYEKYITQRMRDYAVKCFEEEQLPNFTLFTNETNGAHQEVASST